MAAPKAKKADAAPRRRAGIRENAGQKLSYGPTGLMAYGGNIGYRSPQQLSQDGVNSGIMPISGDRHALYDRPRMIQESRRFYRDSEIFKGLIDRYVAYVIGGGFVPHPHSGRKNWDKAAFRLWNNWSSSPEERGILSMSECATMAFREKCIAGDSPVLKLDTGNIQILEAEQLSDGSPFSTGVELNPLTGRPMWYDTIAYNESGFIDPGTHAQVAAEHVLLICQPERPSSFRGIPSMQSAFSMMHRIKDMCDAVALAAQMLAHIALIVNRKDAQRQAWQDSEAEDSTGLPSSRVTQLDVGLIFHGDDGEEIRGVDQNIPGQNFPENLKMFMRLLGLALGIPLEVIMLLWSDSNYSQSRAVMEQFFRTVGAHQKFMVQKFYEPLWKWKVDQWIAQGLLADIDSKHDCDWLTPAFPWLDPQKEALAQKIKLELGLTTQTEIAKGLDKNFDTIQSVRDQEFRDAIARAQAIKKDLGVDIPWEYFAGMTPAPKPPVAPEPAPEDDNEEPPTKKDGKNANPASE